MLIRDAMSYVEIGEPARARELIQKALQLGYSRDQVMRNEGLRKALEGK